MFLKFSLYIATHSAFHYKGSHPILIKRQPFFRQSGIQLIENFRYIYSSLQNSYTFFCHNYISFRLKTFLNNNCDISLVHHDTYNSTSIFTITDIHVSILRVIEYRGDSNKNEISRFIFSSSFSIFVEYRIRFGRVKSEMKFPFAFTLAFRYICRVFL